MIINYRNLERKDFLYRYFNILNTAQPSKSKRLSASEIKVLVEFILLPDKFENKRFGTLAKKKVLESLLEGGYKLTRANLNNKIYSLLEKDFLWKDTDAVIYPKEYIFKGCKGILKAVEDGEKYDITFRFSNDIKRSEESVRSNS